MMRFAEMAAPFFDTAEVIELHHDAQGRRPVGHGREDRRADGRGVASGPPTRPNARSTRVPAVASDRRGIRAHSVRMRGMVAHQEVILGSIGQTLTIRQDSYDRDSFMPGVILACKRIADHPGLTARPRRTPRSLIRAGRPIS